MEEQKPLDETQDKEEMCCPKFDPNPWEDKTFEWKDKKFIKDKVFCFMNIPINFGAVMKRLNKKVEKTGGSFKDYMGLSDHTSSWNMDIYAAVDKEIPGAENAVISGKFYSKVYEGDFSKTGEWCKDFAKVAKEKGLTIKKWYMWYTTCPKCAKKYGKNYTVIIGKVE